MAASETRMILPASYTEGLLRCETRVLRPEWVAGPGRLAHCTKNDHSPIAFSMFASIPTRHRVPKLFIAQIVTQPHVMQITPKPVNSHPSPMATIRGSATIEATHDNTFRTKLFNAIPWLAFLGMNSVSIVVTCSFR